jgi:hypothetical protein
MDEDALQALLREAVGETVAEVPQSQACRPPAKVGCAILYLRWPTPGRFALPRFAASPR